MTPYEKFLKENDPEQYAFYMAIESGESDGDVITTNPDADIKSSMTEVHVERQENTLVDTIIDRFSLASRYDESKHPRGQPKNKGQFAKGHGGGSASGTPSSKAESGSKSKAEAKPATAKTPKPPKKPTAPDQTKVFSKLRALIHSGELPPPADPDIKPLGGKKGKFEFEERLKKTHRESHQDLPIPEHGEDKNFNIEQKAAATRAEHVIAKAVNGIHVGDRDDETGVINPAYDVLIPRNKSLDKRRHFVEVKYKHTGDKNYISMKADSLIRKIKHAQEFKDDGFHTIFIDVRDRSYGGAQKGSYSGHDIYYRRGSGEFYGMSNMYKVKDFDELKRLISAPDESLPIAARGHMPEITPELERKAALDKKQRDKSDKGEVGRERKRKWKEYKKAELEERLKAI